MTDYPLEPGLHWTEHFIKYGFAVLRQQVDRDYCARALEHVRDFIDGPAKDLPYDQWTVDNIGQQRDPSGDPLFDQAFEQPGIRQIIETMYGTSEVGAPTGWDGNPVYRLFINPFNPRYEPKPLWGGHIDFGGNIIPAFGNAFVIQLALHETEPFGGNITVVPGSHRLVQQRVLADPATQYPYDFEDFPFTEPFEFVAEPGDVFLMHHMCFHSGNPCGGPTRKPRLALHMQAQRTAFLTKVDPADPANPPWVRSFALNGPHEDPDDEQRYIRFCANKKAMWGVWEGESGEWYKLFTYADGTLRAKYRLPDGREPMTRTCRFDGERFRFEQEGDGRAQVVLEPDPADPERLVGTVEGPRGRRDLSLRRTEKFTGRLWKG